MTVLRAALAMTIAAATTVLSAGLRADQTATPASLTNIADGRAFSIPDSGGKYTLVHFLISGDSPPQRAFLRDQMEAAKTLAATQMVFVTRGSTETAKAWLDQFTPNATLAVSDPDGSLAQRYMAGASEAAGSVTLLIAKDGRELLRIAGSSPAEYPSVAELTKRIDEATGAATAAQYNISKGSRLAVAGYDVVAYFTDSKAIKGIPNLEAHYQGVVYRFASPEHRDHFVASPTDYLPTYGGWCAGAMGDSGRKVEIDPTNFKVKDGRLFLFYKSLFADARKDWDKNEKQWEPAADGYWKQMSGEDPTIPAHHP